MQHNLEKAQIMFKLARKDNWNNRYDRTEHFKRFQNLDKSIKELSKINWIIVHNKPNYIRIALNTQYKKEIVKFIEEQIPKVSGIIN